jgi:uncharacterized membrane protein (DUF4010 family)
MTDTAAIVGVAAAALGGLAVGVERQRSGHATGPTPRFAGVRTLALLGGMAGVAGWLWLEGDQLPAALLLGGGAALVVAAYVAASRHDVDGTTEVAALVVLAAGFLAGTQRLALASGVIATTVLILVEKSRLHRLVARLGDEELRAAARFAVMAVVILPLLPEGPYGPIGGIRPRALWAVVLLFAGISFVGYIARRAVGTQLGDPLAGLLGGLASSTQVTLAHARASRGAPRRALPLACGALAASTVLFLRTVAACVILSPPLALALAPYAATGFLAGLLASIMTLRRVRTPGAGPPPPANPLQFRSAVQTAVLFQCVMTLVSIVRTHFGQPALILSGALVGLTDVDAVTISMAQAVFDGLTPTAAAQAVASGMLANTLLKLALALTLGSGAFRLAAGAGLAAISLALAAGLALFNG